MKPRIAAQVVATAISFVVLLLLTAAAHLPLCTAHVHLKKLLLLPDGQLSARSDDGTKEVIFRVTHGQRHLALRIERVAGMPPERLAELHFEMNADPRLRVLPLDYMTQADNWDYGVRVAWADFWHRSPQDPLGGFAIYEKTDDDDEDAT